MTATPREWLAAIGFWLLVMAAVGLIEYLLPA